MSSRVLSLAAMWSRHKDERTGAHYEWNRETNEVRWEQPSAAPAASTGWRQERDPASGHAYWWNPSTNERSWHAPQAMVPTPPAGPKPPAVVKPPAAMPPPSWTPEQEAARKAAAKPPAAKAPAALPPPSWTPEQEAAAKATAGSAAKPPFIGAASFQGARPGYVFKQGPKGVGYYLEGAAAAAAGIAAAKPPPGSLQPLYSSSSSAAAASASEVSLDPGDEAEPASVEEIEELIAARSKAKAAKEYAEADELRDRLLYDCGVTVDDKSRTWQCSDGRRGVLEGGRRGAVLPAQLAAMPGVVDAKGNVNAKAAARAASAAAAGWGRSNMGSQAPESTASSRVPIRRSFQPPSVKKRPAEQLLLQSSAKTSRHGFSED